MAHKLLILGGTTEGRRLAERLAGDSRFDATLSLAGRTADPAPLGLPTRSGGFGGVAGLIAYIAEHGVEAVIVATHPYAGRIAFHALEAAEAAGIPIIQWLRPGWSRTTGDRWTEFQTLEALADAIGPEPRRVFVTIGRQGAAVFERAPQHAYWFRSVDPILPALDLPKARYRLERGPFDAAAEAAFLRDAQIEVIVSKNSGGEATFGKIEAARRLGLPVLLLARPPQPDIQSVETLDGVLEWLAHRFGPEKRGE